MNSVDHNVVNLRKKLFLRVVENCNGLDDALVDAVCGIAGDCVEIDGGALLAVAVMHTLIPKGGNPQRAAQHTAELQLPEVRHLIGVHAVFNIQELGHLGNFSGAIWLFGRVSFGYLAGFRLVVWPSFVWSFG